MQRCGPTACGCSADDRADYAVQHPEDSAAETEAAPVQRRIDPDHPVRVLQRLAHPGGQRSDPPPPPVSPLARFLPPTDAPASDRPAADRPASDSPGPDRPSSPPTRPHPTTGRAEGAGGRGGPTQPAGGTADGPVGAGPGGAGAEESSGPTAAAADTQAAAAAGAVDTAMAGGFGPEDEPVLLGELQRSGDQAVDQAQTSIQSAPSYDLQPGSVSPTAGGPTAAPVQTAPVAVPAPGTRPATPNVPAPTVAAAPTPPPVPQISGAQGGAATPDTAAAARSAISSLGARAPPLPAPNAPPPVPLSGATDPAQTTDAATGGAEQLRADQTGAHQRLDGIDTESSLHPPEPGRLAAEGITPASGSSTDATPATAAPQTATSSAVDAGTTDAGTTGASAGGAGASGAGADPARDAARQTWAAQLAPLLTQHQAESSQLSATHAADDAQTRATQVAAIDAHVAEKRTEREQLRSDTRAAVDRERSDGRQRIAAQIDAGQTETTTLTQQAQTDVQSTKSDGEQSATQHLDDGHRDAEQEQTRAEEQVQSEQARAQQESSSWLGQAVSVVQSALAAVRSVISSIWQRARSAVQTILTRARDLARRAIDAAIAGIVGIIRRVVTAVVAIVKRIVDAVLAVVARVLAAVARALQAALRALRAALAALARFVTSMLGRLWRALQALWLRLKAAFAALMSKLKALIRRILKPIKITIGPIQVFPRIGVGGRRLGGLSTGDIPVYTGEIPTEIGIFIVFLTMRTDADLAFTGGGLGPGMIDKLELLVDPLGSRYKGSGTVSVAADASAALTLTATYSGNVSWMGLAGLGIEGGPQIPMSLTVKGANRSHAELEYDHGAVRFARSNDLEVCLVPTASVNAFLKIKAFSGLPVSLPGPRGPGDKPTEGIRCGPSCPACLVDPGAPGPDHDDSLVPYKEWIIYQHRWNLENYRTEKCWTWHVDLAAAASGAGVSAGGSSQVDTSSAPSLFTEIHAAAQPGSGAATAEGQALAASRGAGGPSGAGPASTPATPEQEQTTEDCGDCCGTSTPSGTVRPRRGPKKGRTVRYGDGRNQPNGGSGKHTANARCTAGGGDCDAATLDRAAKDAPGRYGACLTRWQDAVRRSDTVNYGSQLGSEVTGKTEYEDMVLTALEDGKLVGKDSFFVDYGSPVGADVQGGNATTKIHLKDADDKAHVIPVSAIP